MGHAWPPRGSRAPSPSRPAPARRRPRPSLRWPEGSGAIRAGHAAGACRGECGSREEPSDLLAPRVTPSFVPWGVLPRGPEQTLCLFRAAQALEQGPQVVARLGVPRVQG